jgi:superfamily II DNA or RNA helicase
MRATLKDNKWIWFDNITDAEEEVLWTQFSVTKPGMYIDPSQMGNWDGIYRKYNRAKKRMARPLLSMLKGICHKFDIPLVIKDLRPKWEYIKLSPDQITDDLLPGLKLDPHQIRSIQAACKIECGIVDVPTGGGKGEIIAGICKAISCPTVVIADQRVVVEQLKSRLELRDVIDEVGLFYAGEKPNGERIVVGTIQSLSIPSKPPKTPERTTNDSDTSYTKKLERWEASYKGYKTRRKNCKLLQQYVKDAEMLLVDECDKATSDPFKNLFRYLFKGRRRYGFSGTPFDESKPVEGMVMQEHLGSVIARESRQELQRIGRIIPFDYHMLAFGLDGNPSNRSAYDIAYEEWLVENVRFHKLISNICKKYNKNQDDGTLILVDREKLGNYLELLLNEQGIRAHFIYGKTDKRRRDQRLRGFENREFNVLIGGKIINRGLDLKGGCENLVVATGGKLRSDFIQKVGRAVRHNKRGKSKVFDFYFRCNKYLYDHSRSRLKAMIAEGYDTTVHFPGGSIDGEQLVKSRFRIPRSLMCRK